MAVNSFASQRRASAFHSTRQRGYVPNAESVGVELSMQADISQQYPIFSPVEHSEGYGQSFSSPPTPPQQLASAFSPQAAVSPHLNRGFLSPTNIGVLPNSNSGPAPSQYGHLVSNAQDLGTMNFGRTSAVHGFHSSMSLEPESSS